MDLHTRTSERRERRSLGVSFDSAAATKAWAPADQPGAQVKPASLWARFKIRAGGEERGGGGKQSGTLETKHANSLLAQNQSLEQRLTCDLASINTRFNTTSGVTRAELFVCIEMGVSLCFVRHMSTGSFAYQHQIRSGATPPPCGRVAAQFFFQEISRSSSPETERAHVRWSGVTCCLFLRVYLRTLIYGNIRCCCATRGSSAAQSATPPSTPPTPQPAKGHHPYGPPTNHGYCIPPTKLSNKGCRITRNVKGKLDVEVQLKVYSKI